MPALDPGYFMSFELKIQKQNTVFFSFVGLTTVPPFVVSVRHNFKGSPTLILVASIPVTNTNCAAAKAAQRLR